MNTKVMTPENLHEFKFSEVLRSSAVDLQRAVDAGLAIDMRNYFAWEERGKACSVCLAGAAVLGFVEDLRINRNDLAQLFTMLESQPPIAEMEFALDRWRRGDIYNAVRMWQAFSKRKHLLYISLHNGPALRLLNDQHYFEGEFFHERHITELLETIAESADQLEALGY